MLPTYGRLRAGWSYPAIAGVALMAGYLCIIPAGYCGEGRVLVVAPATAAVGRGHPHGRMTSHAKVDDLVIWA